MAEDIYDFDSVSGVPAWTPSDKGCDEKQSDWTGNTWCVDPESTDVGTGQDAWDGWDGCSPTAASMVTGYHSGNTGKTYRETAIDQLHKKMNTMFDGYTDVWNIPGGIEKYDSRYNCWNVTDWNDRDLKDEVNNDRPLLINMTDGGAPRDDPDDPYGNHTSTVVGYGHHVEGGVLMDKYIKIHDTNDSDVHYLTWGNWLASNLTIIRD